MLARRASDGQTVERTATDRMENRITASTHSIDEPKWSGGGEGTGEGGNGGRSITDFSPPQRFGEGIALGSTRWFGQDIGISSNRMNGHGSCLESFWSWSFSSLGYSVCTGTLARRVRLRTKIGFLAGWCFFWGWQYSCRMWTWKRRGRDR